MRTKAETKERERLGWSCGDREGFQAGRGANWRMTASSLTWLRSLSPAGSFQEPRFPVPVAGDSFPKLMPQDAKSQPSTNSPLFRGQILL